jgi:hypothetical protein
MRIQFLEKIPIEYQVLLESLQWLKFNGDGFVILKPKVHEILNFEIIFISKSLVTNEKSNHSGMKL